MTEEQISLLAEQMKHILDLMKADLQSLERILDHDREMTRYRLADLEERVNDQEQRIRAATDGVTQFKVWSSLATGGSTLLSTLALIKTYLGI